MSGWDLPLTVLRAGAANQADRRRIIVTDEDELAARDPLFAAALRRGRLRQEAILADAGMLTSAQVAELLGLSVDEVRVRQQTSELLGLRIDDREPVYPDWQFQNGQSLRSLSTIARYFWDDPWAIYRFLTQPLEVLDGSRPLDLLIEGQAEKARDIAQAIQECGYL
jgi:hypothetical protein